MKITAAFVKKNPELRAMMGRIKRATGEDIGSIYATIGFDNRYWTRLTVYLVGDTAVLKIASASAFMGSDGPGGSVDDPSKVVATVPANGPAIVKALKAAISLDDTLKRYAKLKDFSWTLRGARVDVKGLNAENAQKAVDWVLMDRHMWDVKWTQSAGPAPLKVEEHTKLSDIAAQLKHHGVNIGDAFIKVQGRDGFLIMDSPPKKASDLLSKSFPITKKRSWGASYYLSYEAEEDDAGIHLFQVELVDPNTRKKQKAWLLRNHW